MPSIFTRIVNDEIPAYKVAETDDFLAFLDIRPRTKGHTLVIPKREIDYLFDLPDDLYIGLNLFAREVGKAIEKTVPCVRIGTVVMGLEVPHCHIHLIPMNAMADLSFERPPLSFTPEEFSQIASAVRAHL